MKHLGLSSDQPGLSETMYRYLYVQAKRASDNATSQRFYAAAAPLVAKTNIFMRDDGVILDILAKQCKRLAVNPAGIPTSAQLSRFVAVTSIKAVSGLFGEAIAFAWSK